MRGMKKKRQQEGRTVKSREVNKTGWRITMRDEKKLRKRGELKK